MENSSTSSSVKKSSGKKEIKTSGFPGFIEKEFDRKTLMEMPKEELHRFYRLYGAQIVKNFYVLVGVITTPTKFKLSDFPKRDLVVDRISKSSADCSKMNLWMKNMILLNDVVYRRLVLGEEYGHKESTGKAKKPKKCDRD